MEYNVLTSGSSVNLAERVNDLINFGWEPIGGVGLMVNNNGTSVWFQAVIKGD